MANAAAADSELIHRGFKKKMLLPRTLLYTCVDPEAVSEIDGGKGAEGSSNGMSAAGGSLEGSYRNGTSLMAGKHSKVCVRH